MNYKNALCFILIGLIVLFSGCTQKKGTNEQDNHDYQFLSLVITLYSVFTGCHITIDIEP